jgi:carboxyl-terminal processing protease
LAFGSGFAVAVFQPQGAVLDDSFVFSSDPLKVFDEAWDVLRSDFYGPLPSDKERTYGAIRGLLGTLNDPYTVFVEPIPHRFEQDNLRGSYGGIGATLGRNADGEIVLSPFRDSPAAEAGILEGDVLVSLDGKVITSEIDITQDVESRIRGEIGTVLVVVIRRGGQEIPFKVTRQVIKIPSVTWRLIEQPPTLLGYIHIKSFTDRTVKELAEALDDLTENNTQGLILDLRGNGGGLLQSAIDVADAFFDGGVVLYERVRGQEEAAYNANPEGLAIEIPLVVLIDHGTASASEIVAGAIQDRERGILIGEPTFGKGSVQHIFSLSDGSSLHVTTARWYTPNYHQLDEVGLEPDIVVSRDTATTDEENRLDPPDLPLERAILFLKEGG